MIRFNGPGLALLILLCLASVRIQAASRDVQIRTVDFEAQTLELFNFGVSTEPLTGWRFCTHDDNESRRYTASGGLNSLSIGAGESIMFHFNNDAVGPTAVNMSTLGGTVAGPFDRGPYAIGLYVNSGFGSGTNLADHVQWSLDGTNDSTADERSDEAEGEVWTVRDEWIATTTETIRLVLNDLSGAALHGPADYTAIEPLATDFNFDGVVNGADQEVWEMHFGTPTGATQAQGDADGDEDVDGRDYVLYQADATISSGVVAAASVPEPQTAIMIALISLLTLGNRNHKLRSGERSPSAAS